MVGDTLMNPKDEPHPLVMKGMQELRALPAASNLALMTPRFMLRYPYGKRSDPISEFEFEEFTPSDGLRGMLWGHPAFLATCALAGSGGKNMSIGDLPFYYMVDSYGDQIALPCTERLINTDKATQLSQYGISSVMAYKGQPEVRLAGLKTINGQELELKTSSKPMPDAAAAVSVAAVAVAKAEPEAVEPPGEAEPEVVAAEDSSSDSDLDDLLAGFDDDDNTASDDDSGASDDEGDGDMDDLDDLLASFGDDDDDSDDDDEEMDSDLADLLASLD
jgi:type VI secretion system protein ImpC